jgi:transposase
MIRKNKQTQGTLPNPIPGVLFMASELGQNQWKLGFTTGLGQRLRVRSIQARDLVGLQQKIQLARQRFRLSETFSLLSCSEAGRDGFWLHRYLSSQDVVTLIVDSASSEVNRRARRTKTDRLDVNKLLSMLICYHLGDHQVWRIVSVPGAAAGDRRHLHRELASLKKDCTRHTNRIKGWLTGQGSSLPVKADLLNQLETVGLWDGQELPSALKSRLVREFERMELVNQHIRQLETQRREMVKTSSQACVQQVRNSCDCVASVSIAPGYL